VVPSHSGRIGGGGATILGQMIPAGKFSIQVSFRSLFGLHVPIHLLWCVSSTDSSRRKPRWSFVEVSGGRAAADVISGGRRLSRRYGGDGTIVGDFLSCCRCRVGTTGPDCWELELR
jgi:hypothetical protein